MPKLLGYQGIETYEDYLELLLKHGDGTYRAHHRATFAANGISAYFAAVLGLLRYKTPSMKDALSPFKFPTKDHSVTLSASTI